MQGRWLANEEIWRHLAPIRFEWDGLQQGGFEAESKSAKHLGVWKWRAFLFGLLECFLCLAEFAEVKF